MIYLVLVETNAELREGEGQVLKGLIAFLLGICVQHFEFAKSDKKFVFFLLNPLTPFLQEQINGCDQSSRWNGSYCRVSGGTD
jgi:hypothetical protein